MKKIITTLLIACCMAASMAAMAQNACQVHGVVVDALGETVPYATVGAYKGKKNITRMAADASGAFAMQLAQDEKYRIEITSVGYEAYSQEIELPRKAKYDMGNIVLKSSTQLDEVVVVSQKPLIKTDAEKITYDVTADPESDSKSVLDMMRKVPMVTVDGEDNVQLNGSGDFKVLINGKESTMVKNNLKEVLKAMPASSVQDIQVITNPSTRYDAEGAGGVINIVTATSKVNDMTGVTGTLSAYYNALQGSFGGSAYLTMQHKKFTASLNYSGGKFNSISYNVAERYNYNNPDMYYTEVTSKPFGNMTQGGQYHFLTFESSYELDSLNLFTLGLSGNFGLFGADARVLNTTMSQAGVVQMRYIDNIIQGGTWGGAAANFDYQHTFNRPQHTLTASYRYEYNPDGMLYCDSIIMDEETLNAPMEGQKNENNAYAQEHTVQVDYNNPINSVHSIEAGAKYIMRLNHSDDDYMMLNNGMWQSLGMAQHFDYTQQVASLYAGYGFTKSTWGFRLGGRYEATFIDATFRNNKEQINYGKPYGNFVPYASINYNLSPFESLRFSYTQRINRPGISYLSPYEQWTTPASVQVGNPDLQPEVTHSFSAAYSIFKGKFNLNMQFFAKISDNSITPLTFMDAASDITYTTYGNIASVQTYGLSAYISGQPSPKFNYYINLQPVYKTFDAPHLNMKDARWGATLFAGFNWTAWKNGTVSINGGGGLPDGHMQLESELMWYYYGASVTQRFLDDKLKVTLSANNIFNKFNHFRVRTSGDGFENISNVGNSQQQLTLSVSYTFGNLKAQVKKASRSIVNDDIVGGSSEGPTQ